MTERLTPYVRAALLVEIVSEKITVRDQYLPLDIIANNLKILLDVPIADAAFYEAFDLVMDAGGIEVINDPITDPFYRLNRQRCKEIYREELADPSSLVFKYARVGQRFLQRASEGLKTDVPEANAETTDYGGGMTAPASDRIVTLTHNQQADLEAASSGLIDTVEKENALDGDSALRQRILGQIRAGRELIRAQTLSAYLLYQILVSALGRLVDRYKGHAIGIAAAKLLELLIEHIFGLR